MTNKSKKTTMRGKKTRSLTKTKSSFLKIELEQIILKMSDFPTKIEAIQSLKTLQHDLDLTPFLDFIFDKAPLKCEKIHKGRGCLAANLDKANRSLKVGIQIQLVANLLPGIIMSLKKLRTDPVTTSRKLLIKYLRAVAFIIFAGSSPWVMVCIANHFGLIQDCSKRQNRLQMSYSICVGAFFLLIEPISKHSAYVGYFGPKAFELFVNVLQSKSLLPKAIPFVTTTMQIMACAVIGLSFSRGHWRDNRE